MKTIRKITFVLGALILLAEVLSAQVTLEGVTLPGTLGRNGKLLSLNGGGVRNSSFIDVYVAGLYVKTKSNKAADIINADEPMAVRIQIISSMLTKERMSEAIKDGFLESTNGKIKQIEKEVEMILQVFNSGPINVGDYFDIWYFPNEGIAAWKNGEKFNISIPGLTFKKYLFGIWLGKNPVDYPLKDKMLGK